MFKSILLFLTILIWTQGTYAQVTNPVVPSSQFGPFKHGTYPSLGQNTHVGVDLVASCGSGVFAFADGVVEDVISSKSDRNFKSLGYMVLIKHPIGINGREFHTIYLHLQSPPIVNIKQQVIGGKTQLGQVGRTGVSTGCHTHFEVRFFPGRFGLWGNIYPPGDITQTNTFKFHWTDPQELFRKYPKGVSALAERKLDTQKETISATNESGKPSPDSSFFLIRWLDKWREFQQLSPVAIIN